MLVRANRLELLAAARTHAERAKLTVRTFLASPRALQPKIDMTATDTIPTTSPDAWTQQIEQLRARYKHVRPPILAALNILARNPDISADDAKARASLHGARITAASISAAQRLLARMDSPAVPAPAAAAPARLPLRMRVKEPALDATAMIQQVVTKLQQQGNVEAERLRTAIQRAIATLQTALGT